MSYSKIQLIWILLIIDYDLGKDCAVVTSHTQCSFHQITSFGVGNRKKGRNASCFIVPRLKPNTDFQLSNERKAH